MISEHPSVFRCIKVGAGYGCIWAFSLACLLGFSGLEFHDVEKPLGTAILIGSLAAVAGGVPTFLDEKFRNPASLFYLVVGAVAAAVLLYVVAALAFFVYLILGWNTGSHRN